MAWIFALWAQCGRPDEASAFQSHFAHRHWALRDGSTTVCSASTVAETCCWVRPSNVSTWGVGNDADAARLTEVGGHLYEHLRSAPTFAFALVGVEVDDVRTDDDVEEMIRCSHEIPYNGLVVTDALWRSAGAPASFAPFRPGYRWRPYSGEVARRR